MACATKGKCEYAYIKQGSNAMHCIIQRDNGSKWDFCAHQQFCRAENRYTLNHGAVNCALAVKNTATNDAENSKQETVEAEKQDVVIAEPEAKKPQKQKTKKNSANKA